MKKTKFNTQQQQAIDIRGGDVKNILVSAGAGSGKTAVLAERVIKLVSNPDNNINIDDLLILTFTNNAASEMRERIGNKLKEKLNELLSAPDSSDNAIIKTKRQLSLLNKANVTTIDSFCNTIVKQYFYKLNIDPGYKIAGDDSCYELLKLSTEAMDELFEAKYEQKDSNFLSLMEYFCPLGLKDTDLRDILTALHKQLSNLPYPNKWLSDALEKYNCRDGKLNDDFYNLIMEFKDYQCSSLIDFIEQSCLKEIDKVNSSGGFSTEELDHLAKLRKPFYEMSEILNQAKNEKNLYAVSDIFSCKISNLPSLKTTNTEICNLHSNISDLKKKITQYGIRWKNMKTGFDFTSEKLIEIVKKQYNIINALINLYKEYADLYLSKKNELATYSFSDISQYCVKILLNDDGTPTPEAIEYRDKFAEVIVDEYQDNNQIQECLLNAITYDKNNLFMVGDIKQSIYKFRNACPNLFAYKYNTYNKEDLSQGNICIRLNKNYRSRKSVLDLVNFVFYQIMRQDFGNIDYNKEDALVDGFDFTASDGQIPHNICRDNELILCKLSDKSKPEYNDEYNSDLAEMKSNEVEAHIVAKKISELVNPDNPTYVFDSKLKKYRPCQLSDIAILMRNSKSNSSVFSNILNRYGIPNLSPTKCNLFETIEVKTVMSLLKVLDNPYRDLELILVLHCPVFNVTCDELAVIRLINKKASMYDNVLKYIDNNNNELTAKLSSFTDLYKKIKLLCISRPFCEVLDSIYRLTDYMNYVTLIKNGDLRIKNLQMLYDTALNIYNNGITDFGSIVERLSEIEKTNPSVSEFSLPEYDNAVQILTIHGSKGLEFPIVILSCTGSSLISKNKKESKITIDADLGLAFNFFDPKTRLKTSYIYEQAFKSLINLNLLKEELRLLYVAMTRAKEKLIITATHKLDCDDLANSRWNIYGDYNKEGLRLSLSAVREANNYLDWIMRAYYRADTLNKEFKKHGIEPIDIKSLLKITHLSAQDLDTDELDTAQTLKAYYKLCNSKAPVKAKEKLTEKLITEFLDTAAVNLPSKISISEIKRQYQIEAYKQMEYDLIQLDAPAAQDIIDMLSVNKKKNTELKFDIPAFLSEEKDILKGAERGTAYHTVLEHIHHDEHTDINSVKSQLNALLEKRIISRTEYNSINAVKILKFLQSPLGRRVCKAKKVYRETPFIMQLSPDEVYINQNYDNTSAKMLVQGIIDLYFVEEDYIVLVDYKTDKVNEKNSVDAICERYKIQLDFYKKAIELSTSLKVKEMYLYLISTDEAVIVN